MFERYSERAREVMPYANWCAHSRGAIAIEADDMIAGILIMGEGVAIEVLRQLDISNSDLRTGLEMTLELANFEPDPARLPLHDSSNEVIQKAIKFCKTHRHDGVGTEHILVGWFESDSLLAQKLLSEKHVSLEQVRNTVINCLAGTRDRKPSFLSRFFGKN